MNFSVNFIMAPIPTLDVFAGIGGFSLGLQSMCKTVAFCEINPFKQRILRTNMVNGLIHTAPIFDDIRLLKPNDLKNKPVIVTAGFPCQDISCANPKALGIHGPSSKVIWDLLHLVKDEPSVEVIILENSPCIMTRGFVELTDCLAKLGFEYVCDLFEAAEVGLPIRRKRWFCVAFKGLRTVAKLAANKTKKVTLKRREHVPRLRLKCSANVPYSIARCTSLGDAVIPILAYRATVELCRAAMQSRRGILAKRLKVVYALPTLTLVRGHDRAQTNGWASPSATPRLWYQYKSINPRSTRLLSNQIFHEQRTDREKVEVEDTSKFFIVNPEFVEWLMGFPKGYTNVT